MKIVRTNINRAVPGMKVAEDVFNAAGQLIIQHETLLTDKAITRLRFHSISTFKIYEEDGSTPVQAPVQTDNRSYLDKLKETPEFAEFSRSFDSSVKDFKDTFQKFLNNESCSDMKALLNDVKTLLSKCTTGLQMFDLLHCLRGYDDQTYTHCLNVGIICGVMGSWLKLSKGEIDTLIMCGMFHDIGKLTIPDEIIQKPGKLTADEFSQVKAHALRGYNLLYTRNIDPRIALSAMMHHERCDGSGYPLGIKGDKIEEYAKIVAIADVYDAMTSKRVYRDPLSPFDVIHTFETEGLSAFDTKYVMTFVEHITRCYTGSQVRLNDGRIGVIVLMNNQEHSRPMVQVGKQYIDLSRDTKYYIEKLM